MKDAQGSFSRRDWLAAAGIAAGALAGGAAEAAPQAAAARTAPASPVSVAKVPNYDEDLVAQFQKMFDQIGGLGSRCRARPWPSR